MGTQDIKDYTRVYLLYAGIITYCTNILGSLYGDCYELLALCTSNLYFPACTQGLRRHQRKAYWDLLTLKKIIIECECSECCLKVPLNFF